MPTPEEVAALGGESPAAKPSVSEDSKPEPVSPEDYNKAVQNYENLRSLESKRDKEIHDLREENRRLKENPSKDNDDVDQEEDNALKERMTRLGFIPAQDIDKEVERKLTLQQTVTTLKTDLEKAMADYPFVDGKEVLSFIGEKGGKLTIAEALQLKYGSQIAEFEAKKGTDPSVPHTDAGGRTISVESTPVGTSNAEPKRGRPGGRSVPFGNWFSESVDKAIKEASGSK